MRRAPALVALLLAGCGGGGKPAIRLAAASSLTGALSACASSIPGVRTQLEFGGSDALAAQIRQGIGVDVFAAASMKLPEALAAEHRARPPTPFATNELVLAVPSAGSPIRSLSDLVAARTVTVAAGSPSVPVGSYTRQVLDRLPAARRRVILGRVRTEEPDVKGIVGKLSTGAVDAGFVYRTDVLAASGALRVITLPAALRPAVVYGVTAVSSTAGTRQVIDSLLRGGCARALRTAGFGAPPR